MKRIAILLAALLGTVTAMTAYASVSPEKKCCTRCCVGRGQLTPPVEAGKGSCKAHPGSCK